MNRRTFTNLLTGVLPAMYLGGPAPASFNWPLHQLRFMLTPSQFKAFRRFRRDMATYCIQHERIRNLRTPTEILGTITTDKRSEVHCRMACGTTLAIGSRGSRSYVRTVPNAPRPRD